MFAFISLTLSLSLFILLTLMWLDNNYVGAYTYVIPIYDGSTNSTSKYDLNLDDQYDKIPHQAIMNFVNQYDLPYVEITRFVCDTLTSLNNIQLCVIQRY